MKFRRTRLDGGEDERQRSIAHYQTRCSARRMAQNPTHLRDLTEWTRNNRVTPNCHYNTDNLSAGMNRSPEKKQSH